VNQVEALWIAATVLRTKASTLNGTGDELMAATLREAADILWRLVRLFDPNSDTWKIAS
jgi:hypothetical protein